jgi:hypothetical protein
MFLPNRTINNWLKLVKRRKKVWITFYHFKRGSVFKGLMTTAKSSWSSLALIHVDSRYFITVSNGRHGSFIYSHPLFVGSSSIYTARIATPSSRSSIEAISKQYRRRYLGALTYCNFFNSFTVGKQDKNKDYNKSINTL